jgi:site-specific DNA-methyltransferase (adenine-specific)
MEINTIYNMDCVDGMKMLPEESIDMIITSPPYDNLREYNKTSDWDFAIFQNVAKQCFRTVKWGGVVVWIVNDGTINGSETGTSFRQALYFKDIGFNLHDTMIWKKDSCAFPEQNRYYPNFEYMFVFSKGTPSTFHAIEDRPNKWAGQNVHGTFRNPDGSITNRNMTWKSSICKDVGIRFNVWEIPSEKANKTGHPAVFPQRLARDHIISWSNEGDIVLDPFMGSGTTALACIETNRKYIGFEISLPYYEIIQERIFQATKQQRMI